MPFRGPTYMREGPWKKLGNRRGYIDENPRCFDEIHGSFIRFWTFLGKNKNHAHLEDGLSASFSG